MSLSSISRHFRYSRNYPRNPYRPYALDFPFLISQLATHLKDTRCTQLFFLFSSSGILSYLPSCLVSRFIRGSPPPPVLTSIRVPVLRLSAVVPVPVGIASRHTSQPPPVVSRRIANQRIQFPRKSLSANPKSAKAKPRIADHSVSIVQPRTSKHTSVQWLSAPARTLSPSSQVSRSRIAKASFRESQNRESRNRETDFRAFYSTQSSPSHKL